MMRDRPKSQDVEPPSISERVAEKRCIHLHPSGQRCGGYAVNGSEHFFSHHPDLTEERRAARRRGGRAGRVEPTTRPDVSVRSLADVVCLIEEVINDVRSGRQDVKTGNALAVLASTAIRALTLAELEDRMVALESALEPSRAEAASLRRRNR